MDSCVSITTISVIPIQGQTNNPMLGRMSATSRRPFAGLCEGLLHKVFYWLLSLNDSKCQVFPRKKSKISTYYPESIKDHNVMEDSDLNNSVFWILYYSVYSQQECQWTQYNELLHYYLHENTNISKGDPYNTSISQYFEASEKVIYERNNFSHPTV